MRPLSDFSPGGLRPRLTCLGQRTGGSVMLSNRLMSQGSVIGAVVLAAALSVAAPARSAPLSFDGPWSVLVVTDQGSCDRAYRYGVEIRNGQVFYAGGSGVDISGQVNPRG